MDQSRHEDEPGGTSWDDVVRELRRGSGAPRPPVRSARSPGPGGASGGRHRVARGRRRRLVVVGGLVAVLVAGLLAVRGVGGEPAPVARAEVSGAGPTWADVLAGLDRARARVWEVADPALLGSVDVPGSPVEAADRAVLAALRRDGLRAHGLRTELTTVGVVRVEAATVRLRVVDRRSAYELRDARGRSVQRVSAGPDRAWEVVLLRRPAGWRVSEVVPLGS